MAAPLNIAVCDDEKEIRNEIRGYISLLYPEAVITEFEDGETLVKNFGDIDILFLDIQMDGLSGMEAARRLRKTGSRAAIIFVTAIEEYVFDAFDVEAFNYLIKPIDKVKFYAVLTKAVSLINEPREKKDADGKSLAVKIGNVTNKIYLSDIWYMEVFNRKVVIHRAEDEIEFYGKLKELEEKLGGDFFRCHRSYIVNFRYVLKYDAGLITLENEAKIPMAKQKYADFVRAFLKYTRDLAGKSEKS